VGEGFVEEAADMMGSYAAIVKRQRGGKRAARQNREVAKRKEAAGLEVARGEKELHSRC
jgi:hypothetical protein